MPFFRSSSTVAASAASRPTLPAFLRQQSASASTQHQHQLFAQLNQLEHQRVLASSNSNSPFSVVQALQPSTRNLNRYTDIVPFKHSQILVGASNTNESQPQSPSSTFINANHITAPSSLQSSLPTGWQGYIATQAPLPHTQPQFWRMVYEQNVHVIVCLTAVSPDRTRRAQKAEQYWPLAGETDLFENNLFVKNTDSVDGQEQVAYRHFEVWNKGTTAGMDEKRNVLLVHYQGWPDHGVPVKTDDLREILYRIRAWKAEQQHQQSQHKDFGPTVVHCSAGCGRTGTFCVIDTVLSVLVHIKYPHLANSPSGSNPFTGMEAQAHSQDQGREQGGQQPGESEVYNWEGDRDIIHEALSSFRQERMLMVQTAPQYSFCYDAVRDLCQ